MSSVFSQYSLISGCEPTIEVPWKRLVVAAVAVASERADDRTPGLEVEKGAFMCQLTKLVLVGPR